MDSDEEDEEKKATKGPKFPIAMFITEGNKYLRLLNYNKAIEFFNEALENEPANQKSLIGRSKCNMMLANYTEAKQDAEEILKSRPKSSEAKYLVGEAEYFSGDFEKSFLTFFRAYRVRPNYEGLKLGHQMCKKAIDNALQPDRPITIGDEDVANLLNLKLPEDKDVDDIKLAKDSFSLHLEFLRKLLNDDSIESVHPECKYLLNYLKERQMFWRTQNPKTSPIQFDFLQSISNLGSVPNRLGDKSRKFLDKAGNKLALGRYSLRTMHSASEDGVLGKKSKLPVYLLLSEGNKYLRLLKIENAMASYKTILNQDPKNIKALLGRAKCYLKLSYYEKALQDFQHILEIHPRCTEAISLKGLTEYSLGNFENGFCTYWKGFQQKPIHDRLRRGCEICENVIRDTLKSTTLTPLNKEDVSKIRHLLEQAGCAKARKGIEIHNAFTKEMMILGGILKDQNLTSIHSYSQDALQYLKRKHTFSKMVTCSASQRREW